MGVDESGTLATLRNHRAELIDPAIEEHGGRIVKTTGDGILIEFPSAVDAVQHAVAVQEAMKPRNADLPQERRMEIRMSINVGDVIVEGDDRYTLDFPVDSMRDVIPDLHWKQYFNQPICWSGAHRSGYLPAKSSQPG